jgi:plastocyanin
MAALVFTAITMSEQAAQKVERTPDRTVEITRKDGKLVFVEHGKEKAQAIPIVVGQTIRWENKDTQPHALASIQTAAGKPLFDTGISPPGKYKDVLFDIDLYQRAGGKPANVVTVKYHSRAQIEDVGELHFLSAARRGRGFR